ncbi:MAG: hypothetical protein CNIPEHKO_01978 [Anaerolineales bacterium]|nr:hypothetical protein [Anaerolineales bacterium]
MPVVAFNDLDVTWQAYLFYTINIKPKKINTSLAYDLYPLLRVQDWLEKSPDGLIVYRETRAQELTEILWSHSESPWFKRVNMLGEKRSGDVTQAAFIRSLLVSYVKKGKPIGGLFGDELHSQKGDVLQWSRVRQAAFLICAWQNLETAITNSRESWAEALRKSYRSVPSKANNDTSIKDPAFASSTSLLATDQGVRGILQVTNDMCYIAADQIKLMNWFMEDDGSDVLDPKAVSSALSSIKKQSANSFLRKISEELCRFDWRTSSEKSLNETQRRAQMVFKGSSGYKELRQQLVDVLCDSSDKLVKDTAITVKKLLKY